MKHLSGVLLLAAHSARSQAYVQALSAAGLMPENALLMGENSAPAEMNTGPLHIAGMQLPDLSVSLTDSLAEAKVRIARVSVSRVNAPLVEQTIRALAPRLIIYSGFGGQIVGGKLIDLGIPLLHVHSGWLPDYRGSTTVYYSLLEEGRCAASAILLDHQIDTGPILVRKHYPAPPAGTDIDRRYDTAIRADLLVEVMRYYAANGALPAPMPQTSNPGSTYYVIHPVLKHLALLSLPTEDR